MKCSIISDLHIISQNDERAKALETFFNNPKVNDSDIIFLQGDIFEALAGDHIEYIQEYEFFFQNVARLIKSGKTVYFTEGNHDFHFELTFKSYLIRSRVDMSKFEYLRERKEVELNGKRYIFCHGYEVDYHNKYFKIWYKVYTSKYMYHFLTHTLKYAWLKKLAHWASNNSKKRGSKKFDLDSMRDKYIRGAKCLLNETKAHGVIAGHTHIAEHHQYSNGKIYLNCGFPLRDQKFIYFDGERFSLQQLT